MTKEQALERVEELKTNRFYLAMKDFWNTEDFKQDDIWYSELIKLVEQFNLDIDIRVGY